MQEVKKRINSYYKIDKVLEMLTGKRAFRDIIQCPFHLDKTPSAKIYRDSDGDRIFCYAESKQFSVVDLLLKHNQDLTKWDPKVSVEGVSGTFEWNYTSLDGFKVDEFDFEEFSRRLFRLEKKA